MALQRIGVHRRRHHHHNTACSLLGQVTCSGPTNSTEVFRGVTLSLTLRLLMSYIYGAPSKARNVNIVYIWNYVWQR